MSGGILLLAAKQPDLDAQLTAPAREAGARVLLATYAAADPDAVTACVDGLRELRVAAQGRGPAFRRALREAPPPRRFWLHVRDDDWVNDRIPAIDVVVPLDAPARLAARRLAERHPHVRMADDIAAAVTLLATVPPTRAKNRSRPSLPPALARLLLASPGLPEKRRVGLARDTVRRLLRGGDERGAEELVKAALPRIGNLRVRADLLGDVVSWSLAHGTPSRLARDAYAAELAVADRHLGAGRTKAAADSYDEAMRTAFHPALHFLGLSSPLADDPPGFTAPLRQSPTATAVREGAGRRTPRAERPEGRPTRLLIATRETQAFIGEIRDHFSALPDFETRFVDFTELPGLGRYLGTSALAQQRLGLESGLVVAAEHLFRPHLDQADVVLVDWCTALPGLITSIDPGDTRIIVRLHSYEVFTRWPQLIDFTRVDDLVFVSEHLEKLALAAIPALQGARAPRRHVIPNAMDLAAMVRPKDDDARFTLGLVGVSKIVKDPRWAIEVLRLVRATDPRYRLLLVGGEFQDPDVATHSYAEALARDLAELEPLGAVERLGHTDDVAAALERVGVILSTSVRESFHVGLVEGAASGAVPVVRDWPYFPGAVAGLFPPEWVVGSPQAAAARVLAVTASAESWRSAGSAAADHVLGCWDWPVVRPGYEDLLRGGRCHNCPAPHPA